MSRVEKTSLRQSCESVGLCHSDSSPSDLILGLAVVGIVRQAGTAVVRCQIATDRRLRMLLGAGNFRSQTHFMKCFYVALASLCIGWLETDLTVLLLL